MRTYRSMPGGPPGVAGAGGVARTETVNEADVFAVPGSWDVLATETRADTAWEPRAPANTRPETTIRPDAPGRRVPVQVTVCTSQRRPAAAPTPTRPVTLRRGGRPKLTVTPYAVWADAALATVNGALNAWPALALAVAFATRVTAL